MSDFQKLDEDILALTGKPEWATLLSVLEAENNAALQNQLDAPDWGEVKKWEGYRSALQFVYNLREYTKTLVEQAADADV